MTKSARALPYIFLDASRPRIVGQVGFAASDPNSGSPTFRAFSWESRQDFAARLTVFLDEMLVATNLTFEHIERIGVGIGPGSLTGVRTAVAFLRTLSQVSGKPLSGISLFDWAIATLAASGERGPIRISVPALRDKVFALDIDSDLEATSHMGSSVEERLTLVARSDAGDGRPHFGIWYGDSIIRTVDPSPEALHHLMTQHNSATAHDDFELLLQIAPLYVIPPLAEINLVKRG
ncbi:MAG: hypothetical protein HQM09_10705 [Candidatus Riflebacteria bacterium]|nr:hypothetical protein [Candidatus Riflebacteria bacterium]